MWSALSWGLPHRDRILKAVRTPALSSFCPPLSSAQRSRLHLRDSLFTTREEGGRERGRGEERRKKKKDRKKKRRRKGGKGKKKRKSFDSIVSRSSTTTEVLRNLAASAVSYFERSLRLSFSLIGTSKVKHSNSGGVTVGKAFRSRVEKREEPRREEPCVEISASLKLRSNQRYEEGAKAA